MKRSEFLSTIGAGAAFVRSSTCLGSCAKDNVVAQNVDFVLDLSDPANNNLTNNGGFIIQKRLVVARYLNGNYVAATQTCNHENLNEIIFSNDKWNSSAHGARFSTNGMGLNNYANKGLTIFTTHLSGNQLRITS